MENVTLKNGNELPKPLVECTMVAIRSLLESNPIAFYELVMICRDETHQLFGSTGVILKGLTLLQSNGTVHEAIRDVVLSAVYGEGFDMSIENPIAQEET